MKIRITVEYYGKNYAGWQRQANAITVQEVLEDKLSILVREKVTLFGSGRTDSGVHAQGQVAHFNIERNFPVEKLAYAVNTMLPPDIRVRQAELAEPDFHAQYSAKLKTYRYSFYINRTLSPIKELTSAQIKYDSSKLDYPLMQDCVKQFVGTHDFKAFQASGANKKSTVRTITSAELQRTGEDITFTVTGNGFLYNMVRIMAGTLVWIGLGKLPPDAILQSLETGQRIKAGKTFPPHGLCLVSVEY